MGKPCCENCARYKNGKCSLKWTDQYPWDCCSRYQEIW